LEKGSLITLFASKSIFTMNFKEPNALTQVAEFHDMFDLPILENPIIPSKERCDLRYSLLAEELKEFKEAIDNNDIVEAADALADLQYVLSGAILELGLASKFQGLFDEVHRSNMSKTCKTKEEATKTQEYYLIEKETASYVVEKNGEYLVHREGDGKVLKSINYSPADVNGKI
jgi:predicted HAD superfamily Cof-like phosphohydrolase